MDNIETSNTLTARRRAAIEKFAGYRGEVPFKNTIRSLPEVEVGNIFWVTADEKPYIVSEIEGKKITIKPLDETATVSTGLTVFEMNKNIVSKEPLMDLGDLEVLSQLIIDIRKWFASVGDVKHFLLYGRDIHYVTLLTRDASRKDPDIGELLKCFESIGDLVSVDFDTNATSERCIEFWIRTASSPAELLYLFPYDSGVTHI